MMMQEKGVIVGAKSSSSEVGSCSKVQVAYWGEGKVPAL